MVEQQKREYQSKPIYFGTLIEEGLSLTIEKLGIKVDSTIHGLIHLHISHQIHFPLSLSHPLELIHGLRVPPENYQP